MDKKLMESYLDNIAELIIDEDKIVLHHVEYHSTVELVEQNQCRVTLDIGVERVKHHSHTPRVGYPELRMLLYIYLSKEKSKNSFPISATYLLAGKVKDGGFNISIINESDLKSAYSKFVEITSEHVYSIQKGKSLKDVKVLCGVDKDSSNTGSPTVIKCSKSVLKSRAEVKKKPNSTENQNKKVIEDAFAPRKETTISSEPKNTEASTNKETASKSPKKKTPPKTSPKGNSSKPEVKKPTGSIASMFAKAAQKKAEKPVKEDHNTHVESETKDIEPADSPVEVEKEAKSRTGKMNLDKVPKLKENSKKKKSGSKRKRIQMLSDSEESDSSNEETSPVEENSPVLVSSIEEEKEKEEDKDAAPRNKRKKRKLVDKTVMNEDGYLETRKEIVLETDSENDSEEDRKRDAEQKKAKFTPATEKGKNIPSNNAAKKQASLLNFFKKS